MDSERALAIPDESFLLNALPAETQEIVLRDIREYEIENRCCFKRDETGRYAWMKKPFAELKEVIYSETYLTSCRPEEVKELYKKNRIYNIPIELSKTDLRMLYNKAGAAGLTVGELLENFINDLIGGERTNGSDERMYAEQWFERCWFNIDYGTSSFLSYLCDMSMTDYIEELLDELEYYNVIEKLDDYEKMERQEIQKELEGIFNAYKEKCNVKNCIFKEEIENVKKWLDERENFMNQIELYRDNTKIPSR